jgi:formamidopyrimidine-DNA glycosylase
VAAAVPGAVASAMPERPELDYIVPILARELTGAKIEAVRVEDPVVLRMAVLGDARELLPGRTITAVTRRGHFVMLALDSPDLELAIHPMLAGRFRIDAVGARQPKSTAFVLALDQDRELRYRDDKQMGKVYLLNPDNRDAIPRLGTVGVDVLSRAFTAARFRTLAKKRRDQVKLFLLDKSQLDSLGNAYADEALFAAGVHPKARVRDLDDAQLEQLRKAIIRVLREANKQVKRQAPPIDEKVRDFLKVRNRKGKPCPTCGSPIRVAGVRGHDAFFCGVCQPDQKGRGFIDWRKAKK